MSRTFLTVLILINLPGIFDFKPCPKINDSKVGGNVELKTKPVIVVEKKFEDFNLTGKGTKDLAQLKHKVFLDQNERRHMRHQRRVRRINNI